MDIEQKDSIESNLESAHRHVVMFSGGLGSWATAKIVAERYGTDNLVLLFADVQGSNPKPHIGEDEDTYRFIAEAAAKIGGELVTVMDGRNIWEVFRDKRYLGNSRLASCSHELKQKPSRKWLEQNCTPENTTVYLGIDWTESHRLPAIVSNYAPWIAKAPLTEPPYYDKDQIKQWCRDEGIKIPRLYDLGYSHNNCGGGCVRAGQGQFKRLLDENPERFAVWEREEQKMRDFLDRDVSILRKTRDGKRFNLPLSVLRNETTIDVDDIGGCGCFVDSPEEDRDRLSGE